MVMIKFNVYMWSLIKMFFLVGVLKSIKEDIWKIVVVIL